MFLLLKNHGWNSLIARRTHMLVIFPTLRRGMLLRKCSEIRISGDWIVLSSVLKAFVRFVRKAERGW
jgi:hypothetical protein